MGRRNYGLLDEVFHFVDPIMDDNPWLFGPHNQVQEWVTGSKTTDGQSPYFQTIFPMVIDGFFPGVGSAIGAVDKASTGNWTGAGLSALASIGGFGGFSGGSEANTAQEASAAQSAQSGLSSTDGVAAGTVADNSLSAGDVAATNDGYVAAENASLRAPSNWTSTGHDGQGLLSVDTSSPSGMGEMGGANGLSANQSLGVQGSVESPNYQWQNQYGAPKDSTYVGINGGHQLSSYSGDPKAIATQYREPSSLNAATKAGLKMYGQKLQADQQNAMRMAMNRPQPVAQDAGGDRRQVQSFQTLSPYASFNGGYNPRKRGLMG